MRISNSWLSCVVALMTAITAQAQVAHDGSIGHSRTLSPGNLNVAAANGKIVGANLFHSFSSFNVNSGQTLVITGPQGVRNIFARVTGKRPTIIDGDIRDGIPSGANLILINPRGIFLGPDAQIGDRLAPFNSVVLTTANAVLFPDGKSFIAAAVPMRSATAFSKLGASGFSFTNSMPGSITATGGVRSNNTLQISDGKVLSLIGGHLTISSYQLQVPAGRINLVTAGGKATVTLDPTSTSSSATLNGPGGQIDIENASTLNATEGGGVSIRGGDMSLTGGSQINVTTDDIAGRNVELLLAGNLTLSTGGNIDASTEGTGTGGSIDITAGGRVTLDGFGALISSDVLGPASRQGQQPADGKGGQVTVHANELVIRKEARIEALAFGNGPGGSISITAHGIRFDGSTQANASLTGLAAESSLGTPVTAKAGNISVHADEFLMQHAAQISATTKGRGSGGNIDVDAIVLRMEGASVPRPTLIEARSGFTGFGTGGAVSVHASDLILTDGGVITATTFGHGQGGDVNVNANNIAITGGPDQPFTGLFARDATGKSNGGGGAVNVHASALNIRDAGAISVRSTGPNPAGNINVVSTHDVRLDAKSTIAAAADFGAGGNIAVTSGRNISLDNASSISALALGNGGNITLTAPLLITLGVQSTLFSSSRGENGGSITIDPLAFIMATPSRISANGRRNGGDIQISADQTPGAHFHGPGRNVTAFGGTGVQGSVGIGPAQVNVVAGLLPLHADILSSALRLQPSCGVAGAFSSFLLTGSGGLDVQPGGWNLTVPPR